MKSILEQMEEGRRLRRFESMESDRRKENVKEDLRGRLAYIRQIIQGKPEKEARIILERFVEVEEIVDELIYFIDHDTSLYPRGSGPKIRQDLIEKGGAIPFFKANREFLGLFVIDGHGWLLQEIVKLYDLLSTDAAPPQTETREERRALIDKKGESAPKAVDHAELLKKKGITPKDPGSLIKCLEHLNENGWIEANPNFPDREESPYRIPSSEAAYNVARYQKEQKPAGMKASEFGGLFYYDGKPFDIESRRSNLGKKKTKP